MKTAVEWLVEQLKEYKHLSYNEQYWIFEQAKEMFEQQIIDARDALFNGTAKEYYKETFKSE
jgi:hypothetical protein